MKLSDTMLATLVKNEANQVKSISFNLAKRILKFIKVKALRRYGYSIEISDSYRIKAINDLIRSFDKDFNKRNISDNGLLSDTTAFYIVDENTIMHIIAGDPLSDQSIKNLLDASSRDNRDEDNVKNSNRLRVSIYGRYAKKWFNKIKDITGKKVSSNLHIFNISSNADEKGKESFQSIISDMKPRDIDTLFYEEGIKESVIKHIDGFFNSKKLYEDKNINYKTSILLYGPPGTGKSSLANALCAKYGLDMVLIDMNTFDKLDVNILTQCINGDDNTYLVLLEDIDTIFNIDRESNNIEKDDKKVINKLLQFLDSNSSPNNVIFIYTTNYINKLDEALLRKGRVDKSVYIGPIDKSRARLMCESFDITEENINDIMNNYPDGSLVNQSTLQSEILDKIKIEAISKITSLDDMVKQVSEDNEKVVINELTEEEEVNE